MSCPRILETNMAKIRTPMEVAEQIYRAIEALGIEGKRSEDLIEAKAEAMSEYDKLLGSAEAKMEADGDKVTLIKDKAKGNIYKALYAKIVAEESLKAHYSKLSRLEAQLNGLQSINRYLQNVSRGD